MSARHFFKVAADGCVEVESEDEASALAEDCGCWVDGKSARADKEFEKMPNSRHAGTRALRILLESWRLDVEHFME
jgi:hypothetical protein